MKKLYIAALIAVNGTATYGSPSQHQEIEEFAVQRARENNLIEFHQQLLHILENPSKISKSLDRDRIRKLYTVLNSVIDNYGGGCYFFQGYDIVIVEEQINDKLQKYIDNPSAFPNELNEIFPSLKEYITLSKPGKTEEDIFTLGKAAKEFRGKNPALVNITLTQETDPDIVLRHKIYFKAAEDRLTDMVR